VEKREEVTYTPEQEKRQLELIEEATKQTLEIEEKQHEKITGTTINEVVHGYHEILSRFRKLQETRAQLREAPTEHPYVIGPFGTIENPVIVPSHCDARVIGCTGKENDEHELTWHIVSSKRPVMCIDCGQIFKHKKIPFLEKPPLPERIQHYGAWNPNPSH